MAINNRKKTILFLVIAGLLIAFGFKNERVCAASVIDSGSCDRNINWELNSDYILTLSTSGVSSKISDRPWDQYKDRIREVAIGSNITEIAGSAFMNYESLEKVQLPNNSIKIGNKAFFGCVKLSYVRFPTNTGYAVDIDEFAFINCALTSIDIKKGSIGNCAFQGCQNLKQVIIGSGVTQISVNVFPLCSELETFEVSEDNSKYSSEDGVLFNKAKTVLLQYPQGKQGSSYSVPESVKTINSYSFKEAVKLSSVKLGSNVTDLGELCFYGCSNLKELELPSTITDIPNKCFSNCTSLESIILPKSIEAVGSSSFNNCTGLKSVYFRGDVPAIDETSFTGVTATVYYPENNNSWTEDKRNNYSGNLSWQPYELPKTDISSWTINVLDANAVTYDGTKHEPTVSVKNGSSLMTKGKEYTVSYTNNVFPGTASIIITGIGEYTGTRTYSFEIKKATISLDASAQVYEYDGNEHEAKVTVKNPVGCKVYYSKEEELTESNYQTAGSLNGPTRIKAGTTKAWYYVVHDSGYYEPSKGIVMVMIKPKVNVTAFSGPYDGERHKADISAEGGATIYYSTVTKLNDYNYKTQGTLNVPWSTSVGNTTVYYAVVPEEGLQYYGEFVSGQTNISITKADQELTAETDSTAIMVGETLQIFASSSAGAITYETNNPNIATVDNDGLITGIGEGSVVITVKAAATSNYSSASKSIVITVSKQQEISISKCDITIEANSVYSGEALKPKVILQYNGKTLQIDKDYSLKYTNNINAGTARVTINGKGIYIGSTVKTFEIKKAAQNFTLISSLSSIKVGSTAKITLSEETPGAVTYASEDNSVATVSKEGLVTGVAKGIVTITATAEETDNHLETVKTISIDVTDAEDIKKDISSCEISLSRNSYTYDGTEKKPTVTVKDGNNTLRNEEDYVLTYPGNLKDAGLKSITVTGADAYEGSCEISYEILKAEPKLSFAIAKISKTTEDGKFTNPLEAKTDGKLIFSSSDNSVAIVDEESGEISILGVGNVIITAKANEGKNYKEGIASYELSVENENISQMSIDSLSYSFGNNASSFCYGQGYFYSQDTYELIFGKTTKAAFWWDRDLEITGGIWRGNCAGFSGTSALLADSSSGIKVNDFNSSAKSIGQLDPANKATKYNMDVTRFIESMQIAQHTQLFSQEINQNRVYTGKQLKKGLRNLNKLYQTVREETNAGRPVILALYQNGAHAVLAYGTKEISNKESQILIYDSNWPGMERILTISKDDSGKYMEWSYEIGRSYGVWGTDSNSSSISYVPYSIIKEIWTTRGHLLENENVLSINSGSVAIYTSGDKPVATVTQGELSTTIDDIHVIDYLSLERADSDTLLLSVPVDVYRFKNLDESVDEFEVSMANTNLGAKASTTADAITMAVDDSCNLNAVYIDAGEDDTYSVTLNSSFSFDDDNVVVSGKGNGETLEISQSKGNISINNCQITSISIDGKEIDKYQIKASAGEGGTINPEGNTVLTQGMSQDYQIKADTGYVISDVIVDGRSVGAVTSYSFEEISADHIIEARFEKKESKQENRVTAKNITVVTSTKSKTINLNASAYGKPRFSYSSNNKTIKVNDKGFIIIPANYIGKCTITIKVEETESYGEAIKKVSVSVLPSGTAIKKFKKKGSGKFVVTWKKNAKANGYQVCYSMSPKFENAKIKTITKNKVVKATLKGKKKKVYYVRIRTYKMVAGRKYYSGWSKVKAVRIR